MRLIKNLRRRFAKKNETASTSSKSLKTEEAASGSTEVSAAVCSASSYHQTTKAITIGQPTVVEKESSVCEGKSFDEPTVEESISCVTKDFVECALVSACAFVNVARTAGSATTAAHAFVDSVTTHDLALQEKMRSRRLLWEMHAIEDGSTVVGAQLGDDSGVFLSFVFRHGQAWVDAVVQHSRLNLTCFRIDMDRLVNAGASMNVSWAERCETIVIHNNDDSIAKNDDSSKSGFNFLSTFSTYAANASIDYVCQSFYTGFRFILSLIHI